jgi:DNA-binding GntR family transcriptional regulator
VPLERLSESSADASPPDHYPIQRRPLPNEVVRRLRALILDGELEPGARVPEKMLSAQFGVSRTPLREAFKVLATEGLIDLLPHRGAVVARLTGEDLDHMFPVLESLEGLAGELACSRITDSEIAEIRALHIQMQDCFRKRERAEYFAINQLVHEKIMAAAANPVLTNVYSSLSARIRRARYMANVSDEIWKQAAKDHQFILKALIARDGARLSRLLKEHLEHKREGVKRALALGSRE